MMKTIGAIAFALMLPAGMALAQGSGGSGGSSGGSAGGAETTPGGTSTGTSANAKPMASDCAKGYQAGMRWTRAEFDAACKKQ
jgi:hypothetical protein